MATLKTSEDQKSEILVIGLSSKDGKLSIESGSTLVNTKALQSALADLGATGKAEEVLKITSGSSPRLIVTTGLGESRSDYPAETLRRAAGAATREIAGHQNVDFALPHKSTEQFAAIAEGIALGAYNFTDFRFASLAEQKKPLVQGTVLSKIGNSSEAKNALRRANTLAVHTHLVRNLVNTPPSHLTPASFSDQMKKLATKLGVKAEIFSEAALKSKGFGGISGVGQGSANPPRLLHLSYKPATGKPKARIALVGKGITFDSGGLALKPAAGMEAMKCDMAGAAAIVATILAAAELKLPVAVDGWAALAENMVSDTAQRPSDVITIYGGKTVEVLNPDAEGRLVLADALVKAQEVGKKAGGLDALIDVATLTGAQGIALGNRTSAVMTNNDALSAKFLDAARKSGELFWPMPLPDELRSTLDSAVADLGNISNKKDRQAGMLIGGVFLREFVEPTVPWIHLDIASPAYNEAAPHGYTPVGGTGVAVRSLLTLLESF
ncbi:MAG: leucyl aminopeptidase [Actinomycetes bacterium]